MLLINRSLDGEGAPARRAMLRQTTCSSRPSPMHISTNHGAPARRGRTCPRARSASRRPHYRSTPSRAVLFVASCACFTKQDRCATPAVPRHAHILTNPRSRRHPSRCSTLDPRGLEASTAFFAVSASCSRTQVLEPVERRRVDHAAVALMARVCLPRRCWRRPTPASRLVSARSSIISCAHPPSAALQTQHWSAARR